MRRLAAALLACVAGAAHAAGADSLRLCERTTPLTAQQQDRLLQFAAVVQAEIDAAGDTVALVARSGQDLGRFGVRYSHAGIGLRDAASREAPAWSVRQLYYACAERRPRLYDQGLAGFLFGTDDPGLGYVSVVLLPPEAAAPLADAARDRERATRLVAARYSANAYPWSVRYQNCNQWVMELLAHAWGGLGDGPAPRERAQRWLAAAGYAPRPVAVDSHLLMAAAWLVPWLQLDDHPEDERFALRIETSLPASVEAFVQSRWPGARRIELCHDGRHAVVRHGWTSLADGCRAEAGDRVVALD